MKRYRQLETGEWVAEEPYRPVVIKDYTNYNNTRRWFVCPACDKRQPLKGSVECGTGRICGACNEKA